jgi:hypothetical protein
MEHPSPDAGTNRIAASTPAFSITGSDDLARRHVELRKRVPSADNGRVRRAVQAAWLLMALFAAALIAASPMRPRGVLLLVLGGGALFWSAGMREWARQEPSPTGTVVEVGEDIRRRRGDEVAATYYAEASQVRARIAAKAPRVALIGMLMVVAGIGFLVAH